MTGRTLAKGMSTWRAESEQARDWQMNQMVDLSEEGFKMPYRSSSLEERGAPGAEGESASPDSRGGPQRTVERDEGVMPASEDMTQGGEFAANGNKPQEKSRRRDLRPAEAPLIVRSSALPLGRLKAVWIRETSIIPKVRLLEVLGIWVAFLVVQILKGGRRASSIVGIRSCTSWFWIVALMQVPLCALFTAWVARRLHQECQAEARDGDRCPLNGAQGDLEWTPERLLRYPCLALATGMLAGLLGIGGGMVIGPLLLEMGMQAQATAATGALMVLFSSSMAVAQFGILHLVPLEFALVYGGICALAAFVGLVTVRVFIRRWGRSSIIILALALVIGTSAAVIAVTGVINFRWQLANHTFSLGFQPLCHSG
eukprot:TRINITY_DN499_c0_g1_i1.p1 TRINITY_DN499_c0_g1~~TRINITY_DN499_c0_g1_i1.p1  ORF type:complete len:371 (-),score=79.91 TRINITY_DN499_c0_g1_i1:1765-2877(-)